MIQELILNNWKSFESAHLNIDPLTFVIGTNASGKSNILDAFQFLLRTANSHEIRVAINGKDGMPPLRGGLDWLFRKGTSECEVGVVITDNDRKEISYRYSISLRKTTDLKGCEIKSEKLVVSDQIRKTDKQLFGTDNEIVGNATIPVYFKTGNQGPPRRIDMDRAYSVLARIGALNVTKEIKDAAAIVSDNLTHIFILDPIPNHMRDFSPLSETLSTDAANIAGILAALPIERKKQVEDDLTKYIHPLPEKDIYRVWAEPAGTFNTYAMLCCEEGWAGQEEAEKIDAKAMSDGTLRFIAIVTALLTGREKSLLIVEEIDNGLHPSRAKELVKMLQALGRSRQIDILCTTHNPALIDALGNTMIPFISYVKRNLETGASTIELLEDRADLAKLMAGGSVGNLMTQGKI